MRYDLSDSHRDGVTVSDVAAMHDAIMPGMSAQHGVDGQVVSDYDGAGLKVLDEGNGRVAPLANLGGGFRVVRLHCGREPVSASGEHSGGGNLAQFPSDDNSHATLSGERASGFKGTPHRGRINRPSPVDGISQTARLLAARVAQSGVECFAESERGLPVTNQQYRIGVRHVVSPACPPFMGKLYHRLSA